MAEMSRPGLPVFVGVDFGSAHNAASFTASEVEEGQPVEIPMASEYDDNGNLFEPTRLPAGLVFLETEVTLLGFEPITDPENTSSGLKQALDERFCTDPLGEGVRMQQLLKKYSAIYNGQPRKNDRDEDYTMETLLKKGITMTLKHIWERIVIYTEAEKHKHLKLLDKIDTIVFTVPMLWHQSPRGEEVQDLLGQCAADAGFPDDKIIFIPEQQAAFAYVHYLNSLKNARSNETEVVFMAEVGAGTVEVMAAETQGSLIQLLCSSKGCAGGMADVWPSILEWCHDLIKKQIQEPSMDLVNTLFETVHRWVCRMDESTADFTHGTEAIEVEKVRSMMNNCYKKAFALAKEQIREVPNLTKVSILGRAPASNLYLKALWKNFFEQCRQDLERDNIKAQFTVEILGEDIASRAVHMGASLPFTYQPRRKFIAHPFGILIRDEGNPKDLERVYIQDFKRAGETAFCKWWEKFRVNDRKANELVLDLQTFSGPAQQLETEEKSRETGRCFYLRTNAVSMGEIIVDLGDRVKAGQYVWVRFKWKTDVVITLEVDCSLNRSWRRIEPPKSAEKAIVRVDLELRDTANTVYVVTIRKDQHGENPDENEDESGQENEDGAEPKTVGEGGEENEAGVETLPRKRKRIPAPKRSATRRKLPAGRPSVVEGTRSQDKEEKTVWDISSDEDEDIEEERLVSPGDASASQALKRGRPRKNPAPETDNNTQPVRSPKRGRTGSTLTPGNEAAYNTPNDSAPSRKRGRPRKKAAWRTVNDTMAPPTVENEGSGSKPPPGNEAANEAPGTLASVSQPRKLGRPRKKVAQKTGNGTKTAPIGIGGRRGLKPPVLTQTPQNPKKQLRSGRVARKVAPGSQTSQPESHNSQPEQHTVVNEDDAAAEEQLRKEGEELSAEDNAEETSQQRLARSRSV